MNKAFTLIEILLVVAIIAILASIVIIAINPAKQLADARNAQRWSDVNTILNATYQYAIDNNGDMPNNIPVSNTCSTSIGGAEICQTDVGCSGLADLSVLTNNQTYLIQMPVDPQETSASQTGYYIVQNDDDRIIVCAPSAEQGEAIEVSR
jgi:type IV pilus assembly protein PilA